MAQMYRSGIHHRMNCSLMNRYQDCIAYKKWAQVHSRWKNLRNTQEDMPNKRCRLQTENKFLVDKVDKPHWNPRRRCLLHTGRGWLSLGDKKTLQDKLCKT